MSSWREQRRLDTAADRAEARRDADAALDRRLKEREAARKRQREDSAARDADKRRKKRERKAAWKQRADWVATNTDLAAALAVMVAGMIPAFYFQLDALMGAGVFAGLAGLLAFMLEAGAWAATAGEVKALKAGRTVLPYRIAVWTFTTAAASINFAHGWQTAWWLGLVLAASSVVPVALFHMVMAGRHKAKPKTADAKARRKHHKGRKRKFKDVATRQKEILLAAPFGTITPEAAWAQAWWDKKGAPLTVTADVIADRLDAEADVSYVLDRAERTPERLAVEHLLADIFGYGGGDGGPSGTSTGAPEGGPRGGAPKARTALGGKGKRPVSGSADEAPVKPLEEGDLKAVRKLAEALGGVDRLSARNVREAIGCRNEYALRLRDAVRSEGDQK
ncbi:hypothetical protein [Streptomyces sp. NPDC001268]|uniref:hypothetical protein n=1 Tax=Streptomyces sp. NPDC001268 TaxID=3364553 RepID=UPI003676D89A